jgi:uncharacterized membrane protein YgcG
MFSNATHLSFRPRSALRTAPRRALPAALAALGLALCLVGISAGSAQASVLWAANVAKPATETWANVAAESGRITTAPFASMPGGKAYRVEIREGDSPGGYGERSELAMGNPEKAGVPVFHEGEEVWIAFQFRMQSPYPISENHNAWNLIFQLHQAGGSSPPPFEINVERNLFIASHRPSEAQTGGEVGSWPAEVDKWSKFLLHVKFSSNAGVGFVEMFGELNEDKSGIVPLLANMKMPTIFEQGGVPVPTHARIGTYRGNWAPRPTAVTYYGGFTVAADRASAETSAFGSAGSPGQPVAESPTIEPPAPTNPKSPVTETPPTKTPPTETPVITPSPAKEGAGSSGSAGVSGGGGTQSGGTGSSTERHHHHRAKSSARLRSRSVRATAATAGRVPRRDRRARHRTKAR